METREILLKADKVNVAFESIEGGKISRYDKHLGRCEGDFGEPGARGLVQG